MKRILTLITKNIVLGLAVTAILYLPAWKCKPPDPTGLVVRVVKGPSSSEEEVQGATVRVYCTEPGCIVEDIQTTGATGLSVHTFEYEAVLAIEVTQDTLSGTGIADLVKNETIKVKVKIE